MPHTLAGRKNFGLSLPSIAIVVLVGLIVLSAGGPGLLQPTAQAATTFTVNSTGDGADANVFDGICDDGAGNCTLRAAIQQASSPDGTDTINFSVTGTINLASSLPDLATDVNINGPGSGLLTVRRDTGGNYRIFTVQFGTNVTISGLTITNGRTADGAPDSSSGNWGGNGGGIYNEGTLTLAGCVITGNSTGNGGAAGPGGFGGLGGFGGGVHSQGTLTMTDCTVTSNRTGDGGSGGQFGGQGGLGGGVNNGQGVLTLMNCVISHNITGNGASGIETNSGAFGGYGGGIYSDAGTLNITNTVISNNVTGGGIGLGISSGGIGGGIVARGSTAAQTSSTFTNVTVKDNRTGDSSGTTSQGPVGGGIYNEGNMTVNGITVSGNVMGASVPSGDYGGGGIFNWGTLTVVNGTFSGNRTGVNASGGGIWNVGSVSLTNCTIAGNTADLGGSGIYTFSFNPSASMSVGNTIVAGNTLTNTPNAPQMTGAYTSQGYNLIGVADGSSTGFVNGVNGDMVGTAGSPLDPLLAPLGNYGGPMQTHALLPGSPAINAGTSTGAPAQDQRGVGHVGVVDVGSFESRGFQLTATAGTPQSAAIFTAFGTPMSATVMSAFGEPTAGGLVTFAAPAGGASGTFSGSPAVSINSGGVATVPAFTANGIAGSYSVTASVGSSSTIFSLSNLKGDQTITFGALTAKTYGDPDFTVSATATSGLNVTFGATGNCTVSGVTVHLTGAGACTVTASQGGDSNYNAAPPVQQSFTINKAGSTTTVSVANATYDGQPHGGSASVTGFGGLNQSLTVTYSGRNTTTYGPSTTAPTNVGDYTASASFAGDANHNGSTDSQNFQITKASQTITFGALANKTFGDADFTVSATATSGLAVSFNASGTCTVTGNTVHITGGGSCTVTASQAGDSNYNAAPDVPRTFQITKANQTITFNPLGDKTFGDADFSVSASASSSLTVSFNAAGNCTATGNTVHITGAGSCIITASQAGDSNYNAATNIQRSFQIAKAATATTVTASNATYDGNPHGGSASVTGPAGLSQSLTVTYAGRNSTTYGPSTTAPTTAGDYTASASYAGDSNYNASSGSKDYSIAKASQTITFDAIPNKTFGDADFTLSATASSGLPISLGTMGSCTVSGSTVHITGAGSCRITATQFGGSNYNGAAAVSRDFNIAQASTSVAVSSSANPSSVGQRVTFTATVTSPAGPAPSGFLGIVNFFDGSVAIPNCAAPLNSGQAACTTSSLSFGSHTITAEYGTISQSFTGSTGTLQGGQTVNGGFQFSQATYRSNESGFAVVITVRRDSNSTQPAKVDYATDDGSIPSVALPCFFVTGIALERCDYTRAAGTLNFAAGDTQKMFAVLVNDDSYTEGTETTSLRLSNPIGEVLGPQSTATLQINDNMTPTPTNLVDDPSFFVRQHYADFLNREPDLSGLQFWTGEIDGCGSNAQCREIKRINVSAAFFLSIEFQETGFLVERIYKTAFGDATGSSTLGGTAHTLPVPIVRLNEFLPDTQQIGQGVIIGQPGADAQLEANKNAFALEFVLRQRFLTAFPLTLTPTQVVDTMNQNAGNVLTQGQRDQLIAQLSASADVAAGRASVLRQIAENATLRANEKNRAFVLEQFFGYLRRNPNDAQDTDYTGYEFWLSKLNQFNGNFVQAEMVKAFISADEYRQRFGQ